MADYGEWMNNLAGMTNALGAASPYAQQLAYNNAQQENLARIIRAGGFSGPYGASNQFGGNYPTQPNVALSGAAPIPSQAPTPFTGFANILARNAAQQARAQAQAQAPVAAPINYQQDGGTGEGSYGLSDGSSAHYDNFKDWAANMGKLPEWASQFIPGGMARDVYQNGGFDPLLRAVGLSTPDVPYNSNLIPSNPDPSRDSIIQLAKDENSWRNRGWWLDEDSGTWYGDQGTLPNPEIGTQQQGITTQQLRDPTEEYLANLLAQARINELSNPSVAPEDYGVGLLSDQPSSRDEIIQQSQDENDLRNDGWWQDEDSGTWYRD